MASNPDFVQYVADQCSGAGYITYRKMFGDYGMYLDGKIFALICDNQFFVKVTDAGKALAPELKLAPPYEGAKPYFLVENIDNPAFLAELARVTYEALPQQKKKRSKV